MLKDAHETAFRKAAEILNGSSLDAVCRSSGAIAEQGSIRILYLGTEYTVGLPECAFSPPAVDLGERILILHYLIAGGSQEGNGSHVTYRGLPGGEFYYSVYRKRGPERLLRAFGADPTRIIDASRALGGTPASYGDVSVRLPALPRVEAIVVFNRGDEEFPPEANILFRKHVIRFLSLEDIAFLAGSIATRLIRNR